MQTQILSGTGNCDIVSIEEAMEFNRITDDYDEQVVQVCLDTAHDIIQQYLNRRLSPTQIAGVTEEFRQCITLPYPPVHKIESIECEDFNENVITLSEGVHYTFDSIRQMIRFKRNWREARNHQNFTIKFVCGYKCVDDVPRAVKHAIRMTYATLYEVREDVVVGQKANQIPSPAKRICKPYRVRPI